MTYGSKTVFSQGGRERAGIIFSALVTDNFLSVALVFIIGTLNPIWGKG
jgi:hypothetical protein